MSFRERTYRALNPQGRLTRTSRFLIYLILFATVVTVLETAPSLLHGREQLFGILEVAFAVLWPPAPPPAGRASPIMSSWTPAAGSSFCATIPSAAGTARPGAPSTSTATATAG